MSQETVRGIPLENFIYQRNRAKAWHRSKGIYIEETDDNTIVVRQEFSHNGHYRTNKELLEIGRFWYPDKMYKIRPVTFCLNADMVTPEWIQEQMAILGLKHKDLVHQLGMNASSISLILQGKRNMSAPTKALFFYYFTLYNVNRALRQPDISDGIVVQ